MANMYIRFLNSLIFNNETDSYQTWTLFLLFVSMSILISGVVLLTHKKPEPGAKPASGANTLSMQRRSRTGRKASTSKMNVNNIGDDDAEDEDDDGREVGEDGALWGVGEASDESDSGEDEDVDHHQNPLNASSTNQDGAAKRDTTGLGKEGAALLKGDEHQRSSLDSLTDPDEFGAWAEVDSRPKP